MSKSKAKSLSQATKQRVGSRIAASRPRHAIVGIGASAGGLEACSELLQALRDDFDLAILLVQHLAPSHESHLPHLLERASSIPVVEAEDGMGVKPGRVHVIPPNSQMEIWNGNLKISARSSGGKLGTIDTLFMSLAEEARDRAIGVVLSGTASDGASGLRAIKAAGGITLAQAPETAKHDGMPKAAIATGVVDLVLPPAEIGRELGRLKDHPFLDDDEPPEPARSRATAHPENSLRQVLGIVQKICDVDFHQYKTSTLERRLKRRMALRKVDDVNGYIALLKEEPNEARNLCEDILIHVTSFFREPQAFDAIAAKVFPEVIELTHNDEALRVWVPGCSSGEEAYSLAIKLADFLGDRGDTIDVQIFATDIAESSIGQAREGYFPETIASDVPADYLRRFFKKEDGGYRIHKSIRDMVVFARQDLVRDPPFSRLDLILCRNVLIYMAEPLQRRLMSVFHYALEPQGFLMLGAAESIGVKRELFELVDKQARLYRKKAGVHTSFLELPSGRPANVGDDQRVSRHAPRARRSIHEEARKITLDRYAPASVLVDADFHILDTHGRTGTFLELAPGEPSLNVLKMAREGLVHDLRRALTEAREIRKVVNKSGVRVRQDGAVQEVNLAVVPVPSDHEQSHFIVYFETPESADKTTTERTNPPGPEQLEDDRELDLERELEESRSYLQSIIHDLEAANEELQSANEEILSSNEELQSTNEELDTAKEELQSTNEELNTINDELEARNQELTRANSDLMNLFANVQVALVIVSRDLRVRRLTASAQELLNIIPSDLGRSIGQIKPNIECPDLEKLLETSMVKVEPIERQVQDSGGHWFALRIRPYKDLEDKIDGAVLTLLDIDELRRHEAELDAARRFSEAIVDTIKEPLLVLDDELKVRLVNPAFVDLFRIRTKEAKGRPFHELGEGQWDVRLLRQRLQEVLSKRKPVDRFQVDATFHGLGAKSFWVHARRVEAGPNRPPMILVTLDDVTDRDSMSEGVS